MSGIFDAHHHLWDTRVLEYRILRELAPDLDRPFLLEEYEREARDLGVTGSLWVEASSAGADGQHELEWVRRHAGSGGPVEGLVAYVALEEADESAFDRLLASQVVSGNTLRTMVPRDTAGDDPPPVVGVRRGLEFVAPEFARQPEVVRGSRLAGERGLVVDLVLFPPSLPAALDLVDACPGTQFVLDHLGKPEIAARRWEPWATLVRELAARPNVAAKLSGLGTEADRAAWTADDLRPYVEHALATFGPARLLYGSDWPVLTLAGSHRRWLEAVTVLLEPLTAEERDAILNGNGRRLYLARP